MMTTHVLCRPMKVVVSRRTEKWQSFKSIEKREHPTMVAKLPQAQKIPFGHEERKPGGHVLPANVHI
jgi:hypothetical protein